MKSVVTIFCFLTTILAHAQLSSMNYVDGGAQIARVIEVDSLQAADLSKAVTQWAELQHLNRIEHAQGKEVRGEGVIESGVMLTFDLASYYDLEYSFIVDIKDLKIRITVKSMKVLLPTPIDGGKKPLEFYVYKKNSSIERANSQGAVVKGSVTTSVNKLMDSLQNFVGGVNNNRNW